MSTHSATMQTLVSGSNYGMGAYWPLQASARATPTRPFRSACSLDENAPDENVVGANEELVRYTNGVYAATAT